MGRLEVLLCLASLAAPGATKLLVTVVEPRSGKPVTGLTAGDFRVLDDRTPRRVEGVEVSTGLLDVMLLLEQHGQYLPFDPLLAERGATLGGTVAAGVSGPGRYRYGGVRDFLLGVRFVDSEGQVVRGGGKVVKNAAGFDFPKLIHHNRHSNPPPLKFFKELADW